tara:strand:+ start:903 stop:2165 length:1263 start_codon:yes stop_codon:yes gene_type:complete
MAIVVDDNTPDFLREFLISQGVISVKDTETGETAVVPLQPRRRPRLNVEGGMEGDFEEGSPITTAASGNLKDILGGLFFSEDPSFTSAELNQFNAPNAPQETSGNSVLDRAANLYSGFGNFVDNSLSKIGGLLSGGISNPFDFDFTPSIDDRVGPISPTLTILNDPTLDENKKMGQTAANVLGTAISAVIPGAPILGLFASLAQRAGAHHDFDLSKDGNLNFDLNSGRTEWDSIEPGRMGMQYGQLNNTNMIEDIASKDPNYQINLSFTDPETGVKSINHISAGLFNDLYQNKELYQTDNPNFNPFQSILDAASPGKSFGSQVMFGNTSNEMAINEFDATGTGAIRNEAGAVAGQLGLGVKETTDLAEAMRDTLAVAPEMENIYGFDYDLGDVGAGGDSGGSGQQDSGGEIGMFDMEGPF